MTTKTGLSWKNNDSGFAGVQDIKLARGADRLDGDGECWCVLVNQDVGEKRWSHQGKCWGRLQRATVSLSLPSPPSTPTLPTHHSFRMLLSLMVMAFTSVYSASAYSPLKTREIKGETQVSWSQWCGWCRWYGVVLLGGGLVGKAYSSRPLPDILYPPKGVCACRAL